MIKQIVFDIGGVVIDLRREAALAQLQQAAGCSAATAKAVLTETVVEEDAQPLINRLVKGEITTDAYLDAVVKLLAYKIDKPQALAIINFVLAEEKPGTVAILQSLAKHYDLACFSNTHALHWDYLRAHYGFFQWIKQPMASHLAGMMKPDPQVFAYIQAQLGETHPQNCLLIDDLPINCAAARAAGWHAIDFIAPAQLRAELKNLHVAV